MIPGGERRHGARFWLSAATGWLVIGIGLRGVFQHTIDTRPASLARFVVGGALLHDLVVAPLVLLVAFGVTRTVPRRARPVIQAAIVITAVVALFSYPLVRAYGRATHNPTSLPHNYALNLTIVLSAVWAIAGIFILLRTRRLRARTQGQRHPGGPSAA